MARVSCIFASCVLIALLLAVPSSGYPSPNNYFLEQASYEPEEIMTMLNRLENLIQMDRKIQNIYKDDITSEKRAMDLGIHRGYSGALQAAHLFGVSAANSAGGPGRRRRDTAH